MDEISQAANNIVELKKLSIYRGPFALTHLIGFRKFEQVQTIGIPLLYDPPESLSLCFLVRQFRCHPEKRDAQGSYNCCR